MNLAMMIRKIPRDTINWFPEFTMLIIVWILSPLLSFFFSTIVYRLINKLIFSENSKISSVKIAPYASGLVFIVYFGYSFSTQYFESLSFNNKMYYFHHIRIFIPSVIVGGFLFGIIFGRMYFFIFEYTPIMNWGKIIYYSFFILYF